MKRQNRAVASPWSPDRRRFLGQSGALAALASIGMLPRVANAAVTDYKALVCIFLNGGNDGNNLIVPLDPTHYAAYAQLRGPAGLALSTQGAIYQRLLPSRSATLRGVANSITQPFAFHSSLSEIDQLFGLGKVGVVLNTGTLFGPLSKAQYTQGIAVPAQLFSHADQIIQIQAGTPTPAGTGWGGRLADVFGNTSRLDAIAMGSSGLFVEGASVHGSLVPVGVSLSVSGTNVYPPGAATARGNALAKIIATDTGNAMSNAANQALGNGLLLASDLQSAGTITFSTVFPSTGIGTQLKQIAQIILFSSNRGPGRQVFLASLGGFDTHSGQAYQQWDLLQQLSQSMHALFNAMAEINLANQVTSFTLSDFGRTLQPNSTGTDHGWGNHHLVVGGALQGGIYGQFPDFTLGGQSDATGRGVWIPQFSTQQFGATLGAWFGVDSTQLVQSVFPTTLANFPQQNLNFV